VKEERVWKHVNSARGGERKRASVGFGKKKKSGAPSKKKAGGGTFVGQTAGSFIKNKLQGLGTGPSRGKVRSFIPEKKNPHLESRKGPGGPHKGDSNFRKVNRMPEKKSCFAKEMGGAMRGKKEKTYSTGKPGLTETLRWRRQN